MPAAKSSAKFDVTSLSGRLQDLRKMKLSTEQILRALNDDKGLREVTAESGLSAEEVGREAQHFVKTVSGAWTIVHVPRFSASRDVMCW